jgi:hypothetical protein
VADKRIKDFLLSRSRDDRTDAGGPRLPASQDRISRRHFIALVGAGACASSLDISSVSPSIVTDGRRIVVTLGSSSWSIDPDLFCGAPSVRWSRNERGYLIELCNATLPGTNLSASFLARLFEDYSGWIISFSMRDIQFHSEASLAQWISGRKLLHSRVSCSELVLGGKRAKLLGRPVVLSLDRSFNFLFEGGTVEVTQPLNWACRGKSLLLRPQTVADESLGLLVEEDISGPRTMFSLYDPESAKALKLNRGKACHPLQYQPQNVNRCCGEVYDLKTGRAGVTLIEGSGLIGNYTDNDTYRPMHRNITLERASLLFSSGASKVHTSIAGYLSESPQHAHFGSWSALISADKDRPFYVSLADNVTPATIDAILHGLNLPIQDDDTAHVTTTKHPVRIVLEPDVKGSRAKNSSRKPESGSIIISGNNPVAIDAFVNLDDAKLSIRRAVDCFNLSFEFVNFDLRIRSGFPLLRRRRSVKPREMYAPAYVIVNFPPQHIAEKYFEFQDPTTLPPNAPPENKEFAARDVVTRARLSGESRLVFKPNDASASRMPCDPSAATNRRKRPKWVERRLSIDALTDWSDLSLCVVPRALPRGSSLEKQLCVAGITPNTRLRELAKQVAAELQPPSRLETALELCGRLILSPSENARWVVPPSNFDQNHVVLWHARLDKESRQSVRAVWSKWLIPGRFPDQNTNADPLLVLKPSHHWELIAQTSLCGLIAVRNLQSPIPSGDGPPQPTKNSSSRGGAPQTRKVSNRVIPPDEYFQAFDDLATPPSLKVEDLGFAVVEPFDDGNLVLTSMGGSLAVEWNGEPFDIPKNSVGLPDPFSLERLVYRSQLGRDIHVETYLKGYLLPLGIRASFVELTERRIAPHPRYGYPVCYLVQHRFIVIRQPRKGYPAVKQPYDSRDFPASRLVMLTRRTPDLIDPKNQPPPNTTSGEPINDQRSGRVYFPGAGLADKDIVFWPRVKPGPPGTDGDVDFRWSIDDDQNPISSKLLFVTNSIARRSDWLGRVAAYYRKYSDMSAADGKSKWHPLVTARLSGTRHRYAPPKATGETAFDTDSWLMSIRGATDQSGSGESFVTDSTLEIADQPPVYPVVSRSQIAVQTLDHLMRAPQGLLEVRFWSQYVSNGFSSNPSEIFLEVLSPAISLNANNNGAATGGLARPNSTLAALSRTTGLIGGRDTTAAGSSTQAGLTTTLVSPPPGSQLVGTTDNPPGRFDFTSASSGKLDPTEFFSPDAKLLGLVSFKTLFTGLAEFPAISEAPRLLEKYEYGDQEAKAVVDALCDNLKKQRAELDGRLARLLQGATTRDLYPNLSSSLEGLCTTDAGENANLIQYVSDKVYKAREVLLQLDHVLNDPLPTLAKQELDDLKGVWSELQNAPIRLANDYTLQLCTPYRTLVSQIADELSALQLDQQIVGITAAIGDPNRWLIDAQNCLLAPSFGIPVASAYATVSAMTSDLAGSAGKNFNDSGRMLSDCILSLNDALAASLQFADAAAKGASLDLWTPEANDEESPAAKFLRFATAGLIGSAEGIPSLATQMGVPDLCVYAEQLRTIGNGLSVTRPELIDTLRSVRTDFVQACDVLTQRINVLCANLHKFSDNSGHLTANPRDRSFAPKGELISSAAAVVLQRRDVIHAVQSLATILPQVEAVIKRDYPVSAKQVDDLHTAGSKLALLMLTAGNIAQISASDSTAWSNAETFLGTVGDAYSDMPVPQQCVNKVGSNGRVSTQAPPVPTSDCLDGAVTQLKHEATELHSQLTAKTITLQALSKADASTYVDLIESPLYTVSLPMISLPATEAAILLQSVVSWWTSTTSVVKELYRDASATLRRITQTLRLPVFATFLDPTLTPSLAALIDGLEKDALDAAKTQAALAKLNYMPELTSLRASLGKVSAQSEKEINRLSKRVTKITVELREGIHSVEKTVLKSSPAKAVAMLSGAGQQGSISRVWTFLRDVLEPSLTIRLGATLTRQQLNEVVAAMADSLREAVSKVLPIGTELGYDWGTRLNDVKETGFALTFDPLTPEKKHLTLSSKVKVKFLQGTQEWKTTGELSKFTITILELVDLEFGGASFDSHNGSDPSIKVQFNNVTLKSGLQFLKALQQFMSPKEGSGPYAIVNADFVRAGYRYDASVLQVGTLQFIHVSLNVFTHIPLRGASDGELSARVGFGFGSEDRPFLIAQPPYGGGGFVELVFQNGRLVPTISLSFGAVVAIHFGPLDGHGRVTSTVTYGRNKTDTDDVVKATVEAIGEGHIGCFGIAVMLQVGLYDEGGILSGSATYAFEFSIGRFLSISFRFTAHYTINGGHSTKSQSSSSAQHTSYDNDQRDASEPARVAWASVRRQEASHTSSGLVGDTPTCDAHCATKVNDRRRIRLLAPAKGSSWGKYRKRLSMELL